MSQAALVTDVDDNAGPKNVEDADNENVKDADAEGAKFHNRQDFDFDPMVVAENDSEFRVQEGDMIKTDGENRIGRPGRNRMAAVPLPGLPVRKSVVRRAE